MSGVSSKQRVSFVNGRMGNIGGSRQHGAVSAVQLVLLLILAAVIAAAAWWFVNRSGSSLIAPAGGPASAEAESGGEEASLPTSELSVDQLYKAARSAMSANRMVAPPGNNALEFYLAIMARRPNDSTALDAVRELFPFATGGAEDQINQGNYDEANRIIDLLSKADSSNYSLTILRSKLDAKRRQAEREQLQAQQQAAAASARTQTAGTTPAATAAPASGAATAAETGAAPAPAAPAANHSGARSTAEVARATPPPSAVPPPVPEAAPIGESRDVRMVSPPRPQYPPAAARARQSGWVEVEFVVGADGVVQDARAVSSNPARVFDREAVRAIEQAKFEPRLDKGQPVSATLRRRIEFKLGD